MSRDKKVIECFKMFDSGVMSASEVAKRVEDVSEPTARKYLRLWLYNNIAEVAHRNIITRQYSDPKFLSTPELKRIAEALKSGKLE